MAEDFWSSSHWNSLVPRETLLEAHAKDRALGLTDENIQRVKIFVTEYLTDLAKVSQQLIRQRVVATAITYLRRFYLKFSFCEFDPQVLGPSCLYVACKSEEAQVQAKVLLQIMRKLSAKRPHWRIPEMSELLDAEMALLEALDYSMVVFSPYRDLMHFLQDSRIASLAEFAWAAVNDSYRTDLCLMYPPFLIALAAITTAAAVADRDVSSWLEDIQADHAQLASVTEELVFAYKRFGRSLDEAEFLRYIEAVTKAQTT